MLVGEAPGGDEDRIGRPFVGAAGYELDRELGQAHWDRRAFFVTNVCHSRPPGNEIEFFFAKRNEAKRERLVEVAGRFPRQPVLDGLSQLQSDIDSIHPTLIIALGNTALWALTGQTGIMRWRGSIIAAAGGPVDGHGIKTIVGLHPAYILREHILRFLAVADLKRAKHESEFPEIRRPTWHFTIPRSPADVHNWFGDQGLLTDECNPNARHQQPLAADVENVIGSGDLICLGFASDESNALCVPFIRRTEEREQTGLTAAADSDTGRSPHYWDRDAELAVSHLCNRMLKQHPVLFHNGLHDCQILARHWGVMPRFTHDSMVMQHVAFPGMLGGKIDPITGEVDKKGSSLSLSFCASLYCDYYRFWKLDGRGWNAEIDSEQKYWEYNCEDNVRAMECFNKLSNILRRDNLWEQYLFEMSLFPAVFDMMFRGVAFDNRLRYQYVRQVENDQLKLQKWIDTAVGHPLNVRSSNQMKALFYDDLQCERILHRKTKQPTLDDKALERISRRSPILKPLIERIQALRTLDVFQDNFLKVRLRSDGRLCGAFNVASPETMRFSSNVDAVGGGMNLQNLPRNPDD